MVMNEENSGMSVASSDRSPLVKFPRKINGHFCSLLQGLGLTKIHIVSALSSATINNIHAYGLKIQKL